MKLENLMKLLKKKVFIPYINCIDVKVVVDNKAVMYLLGTKMDYVEDDLKSEFIFVNPNSKGACGCGESFNV
jgi:iron-sulfur cluster assembly accessory protein